MREGISPNVRRPTRTDGAIDQGCMKDTCRSPLVLPALHCTWDVTGQ